MKYAPGPLRDMSSTSTEPRPQSGSLYNPDLAPVGTSRRTWTTYSFIALWVTLSINITTYLLAASLIQGGMDWKQALTAVFLGNAIVLVPILLNAHPGPRYGIPFRPRVVKPTGCQDALDRTG